MRTKITIQKRLDDWRKRQANLEAKWGYNDGHDFKGIITELEWVLNIKPTDSKDGQS